MERKARQEKAIADRQREYEQSVKEVRAKVEEASKRQRDEQERDEAEYKFKMLLAEKVLSWSASRILSGVTAPGLWTKRS